MTTIVPIWQVPPPDLVLHGRDIHIWRAILEPVTPGALEDFRRLLSKDERERADRFHFERHRSRFAVCRGTLRKILGRYLDIGPGRVDFEYGAKGKPALNPAVHPRGLFFNLAHSRHLALFAVSRRRPLGIDLEYQREMPRAQDLARRFFSPREHAWIMEMPQQKRQEGFYRCWTRKEAFIKAIGSGFAFPLDRFTVSLDPDSPPRLVRVEGSPEATSSWSMAAMIPADGYQAALVAEGHGGRYHWWEAALPL